MGRAATKGSRLTIKDKTDKITDVMHVHMKRIPVSLWRRVRALAAKRGFTVQDQVIIALNEYLRGAKF